MWGESKHIAGWLAAIVFPTLLGGGVYLTQSRRQPTVPTIALIPQSAGSMLWEVEHFGARVAADQRKYHLYWNTPTSESDMNGQIALIDRVTREKYQGLVLAPNHLLGIRTPVVRALAAGLPVVIVSTQLDMPASSKLGYIVNDDEKMGELAAAEAARLLNGKGSIALVGLSRFVPGVIRRARGAEAFLAAHFPNIHIVSRIAIINNTPRAEAFTQGVIDSHPGLQAIVSLTAASTRGAYLALRSRSLQKTITLIGCEQDTDLIGYVGTGEIAGIVAENTYRMGFDAVGLIADSLAGKPLPPRSVVPPILITKGTMNSAEASLYTSFPK